MIDITEATVLDADDIGRFIRSLWDAAGPSAPGMTGATEEVIAEISGRDAIAARLGGPRRKLFIARRAGEIVGFSATRRIDDRTVELAGIMVHPDHQGGIGRPLLERAARTARSDGCVSMRVQTESDNAGALGFYRSAGFVPLRKTTRDVEGTPVEVWELQLEL